MIIKTLKIFGLKVAEWKETQADEAKFVWEEPKGQVKGEILIETPEELEKRKEKETLRKMQNEV